MRIEPIEHPDHEDRDRHQQQPEDDLAVSGRRPRQRSQGLSPWARASTTMNAISSALSVRDSTSTNVSES